MMELYVNESPRVFGGYQWRLEDSRYVILGVPFDSTSSYRPGSREAPGRIREAAANLEYYSIRSGVDLEEVAMHDLGDLISVPGDAQATLSRLAEVARSLYDKNKVPVFLGGEHLITLSTYTALPHDTCMVYFDAHFDLREEYLGARLSHACVLRRIVEQRGPDKIIVVGVRGVSREELVYAEKNSIQYITASRVRLLGLREVARRINNVLERCRHTYISVDMDVFDPAFAPGVGNPEPDGLEPWMVLDLVPVIVDERLRGADIVEANPLLDPSEATVLLAAKTVLEIIAAHYKSTR